MQKDTAVLIALVLSVAGFTILPKLTHSLKEQGQIDGIKLQAEQRPVQAVGFEYADLIKESLPANKPLANFSSAPIGITSHHLPTAVSFIAQFYQTLKQTKDPHQTFVIIGPDHFEHCKKAASTTRRPYYTPFGILETNTKIIDDLEKNGGVAEVDNCFDGEHSIGFHSMFIKFLYPDSTIVPLVYSSAATDSEVERVANVLAEYKNQISVVVSVDFSHYESTKVANQLDKDSGNMIERLDGSGLRLRYMDSPASIKTAIALAKLWDLKPYMGRHANSYEFTGQSENTTGYWNVFFTSKK